MHHISHVCYMHDRLAMSIFIKFFPRNNHRKKSIQCLFNFLYKTLEKPSMTRPKIANDNRFSLNIPKKCMI